MSAKEMLACGIRAAELHWERCWYIQGTGRGDAFLICMRDTLYPILSTLHQQYMSGLYSLETTLPCVVNMFTQMRPFMKTLYPAVYDNACLHALDDVRYAVYGVMTAELARIGEHKTCYNALKAFVYRMCGCGVTEMDRLRYAETHIHTAGCVYVASTGADATWPSAFAVMCAMQRCARNVVVSIYLGIDMD